MSADDRYRLNSDWGAIAIVVESERLEATERGISTPERIWGELWPGESVGERRQPLLSVMRSIWGGGGGGGGGGRRGERCCQANCSAQIPESLGQRHSS